MMALVDGERVIDGPRPLLGRASSSASRSAPTELLLSGRRVDTAIP